MKTITVKARQTVYDIALEQYGTCEAVASRARGRAGGGGGGGGGGAQGIDSVSEAGFYLDVAVDKGAQLRIDDDSTLMRKNALKEITSEITTYQYGTND